MVKEGEILPYILRVHRYIHINSCILSLIYEGKSKSPPHKILRISIVLLWFSYLSMHAFNINFSNFILHVKNFVGIYPTSLLGWSHSTITPNFHWKGFSTDPSLICPAKKISRLVRMGFAMGFPFNLTGLKWTEHQNIKYENKMLNTYEENK